MNETELIHRACRNDEQAWRELVRTHQEAVFRLAYLLTGNAEDAEDVAQETFLRTFRMLHRYDRARPFRPWLLQVARNLARNRYRFLQRYWAAWQRLGQMQWSPRDRGNHATAPDQAERQEIMREETELLWQAIRRLKESDQTIIYLRYFLELSVSETALALNIAEGTAKSRLHRAQVRLAQIVEKDFPALLDRELP